jgi:hypothetical protein
MNIKLLIDNIMRQTTVLIAQLSTAAGVRAPLAQFADQVFLSLAREIEAQGVGRKVVADMFGMALRGYQLKTQRLTESQSTQGRTLFEAILEYIEQNGGVTKRDILERFRHDGERETASVLSDLVGSGLVHATGRGAGTLYGVTSEAERQRLTRDSDEGALGDMLWGSIYRSPGRDLEQLALELNVPKATLLAPLDRLIADSRVQREADGKLRAWGFQVPVGSEHGWESAVFDHFQAVSTAIATKLQLLSEPHPLGDSVGGTTLRFQLTPRHPVRERVLGLLEETRVRLNALWKEVSDYNGAHGIEDDQRFDVVFYFGQYLDIAAARQDQDSK